jgi:long-chain acyl-CoA synthetase
LKSGEHATADEIVAFCRERQAGYKVPKAWSSGRLFPVGGGKVLRRMLRDEDARKKIS